MIVMTERNSRIENMIMSLNKLIVEAWLMPDLLKHKAEIIRRKIKEKEQEKINIIQCRELPVRTE